MNLNLFTLCYHINSNQNILAVPLALPPLLCMLSRKSQLGNEKQVYPRIRHV